MDYATSRAGCAEGAGAAMQGHVDAAEGEDALEGGAAAVADHLAAQGDPVWRAHPMLVQLGEHSLHARAAQQHGQPPTLGEALQQLRAALPHIARASSLTISLGYLLSARLYRSMCAVCVECYTAGCVVCYTYHEGLGSIMQPFMLLLPHRWRPAW